MTEGAVDFVFLDFIRRSSQHSGTQNGLTIIRYIDKTISLSYPIFTGDRTKLFDGPVKLYKEFLAELQEQRSDELTMHHIQLHLKGLLPNTFPSYNQTMQPGEISRLRCLQPANHQYLGHFSTMQNNMNTLHVNGLLRPSNQYQISPPIHELTQQSSSFSNTSTSDEAEEHQLSIIDERKQRRMISNRESARRSRMRKQKHLDELWSQVVRLRSENCQLIDKLNHVSDSHNQAVQENTRLKEEASELRQMINNLQIDNSYKHLRD
ncbi:hypothetical protein IFM89_003352 [Coptis chinensis]|uniref:BZIP domain-containing protein n=1 Tax=Coptis chinensis TaxID=261450 RepID=A0A835IVS0_9MAGN|nr:hypothetical protein IFM89_003352 [Coptis chinensis]